MLFAEAVHFAETTKCRPRFAESARRGSLEVYGRSRVKLLHFVPLHATESLLLLSWAADTAGLREGAAAAAVRGHRQKRCGAYRGALLSFPWAGKPSQRDKQRTKQTKQNKQRKC